MKMMTIVERTILWNSQRYDQVYIYQLAQSLLVEETQELFDAKDPISQMDAVGDIIFVAIGVFWKLGLNEEQINMIFHEIDVTELTLEEAHNWLCSIQLWGADNLSDKLIGAYPGFTLALYCSFIVALGHIRGMKLQHRLFDICHAICDSNATKAIKGKTDPKIKANIDKGTNFIPPTETLRKIYLEEFPNATLGSVQ